jgi:DNA-binding NarL/FixJ family response regulator
LRAGGGPRGRGAAYNAPMSHGDSIGVLVVEDDPATRQALVEKIEQDPLLHVTAACGSMLEARGAIARGEARVALMDLGLPDGDGTDLIRLATGRETPMEVMVITVFADERHVVRAIEAGATGYLLKDADARSVARSIHDLLAGGSPISTAIARHLLRRFRRDPPPAEPGAGEVRLTPREMEVLEVVARGYSNAEISGLLELSLHTVNSHIKSIYRKLAVRSRSEAVFEAVQQGLIQIERQS